MTDAKNEFTELLDRNRQQLKSSRRLEGTVAVIGGLIAVDFIVRFLAVVFGV